MTLPPEIPVRGSLPHRRLVGMGWWTNLAGGFHGGFTGVFSESRSLVASPWSHAYAMLGSHFCAWRPFRHIEWFIHSFPFKRGKGDDAIVT